VEVPEKKRFAIVVTKPRRAGQERTTRWTAAPILAGATSLPARVRLDGHEAVLDEGAQAEAACLAAQVVDRREDDDGVLILMRDLGTEAALLGDRDPRRGRRQG